jgi:aerobic C4-dicarboxylate transport protein
MGKLFKNLTFRVLVGIVLGIIIGFIFPTFAQNLKILADIFVKLIKMVTTPIVFLTIVLGIGSIGNAKKVGRIGGKAILYFEIISTFALVIGILVAKLFHPGVGINAHSDNAKEVVTQYTQAASQNMGSVTDYILKIFPDNAMAALSGGDLIPVLFVALLFGFSLMALGEHGKPVISLFESLMKIFFGIVNIVMKFSPFAAFGAMSFTIGKFGIKSLLSLGALMGSVYLTMFLFITVVLGLVAKFYGFSIFKFIAYIKDEILLVLGTSSSEAALPSMMAKLEKYGCSKSVVGLVVPTGYSFNLDGTNIYLSMATLFIAQAFGVHLSFGSLIYLLAILMLTSKGAAGVTGSGFIVLAATLTSFPIIPVAGIALLIGVDRFMSEARAITNLIGNGVATVVIAKSEKEFEPNKTE